MPYTSCCVALCVSSSRRTPNLQFYRLPGEGDERREQWLRLIRNDSLTRQTTSQLVRICSLHFVDGPNVNNGCPTIFPWSKQWADVITKYNAELALTQKADGPRISPLPLLTPETTGVGVPGLKPPSDEAMSVDGDVTDGRTRVGSSQAKGKKRLRIWVDESDGDEEQVERSYDDSETGNYMVVSDQLGESTEKRVTLPDSVTGTAIAAPKSGEVVTMALTPNTNKMSVHEKAFFSPYHSSQVLNKLADLWRLGKMCDATICVGYTIRIKAHKLVLASMSSVIMNMAAKTDGAILELQLPGDLNVDAVQKFITFLYEGVLYLSATTVLDIQRLATIFKVESVLGYCQTFLLGMPAQSQSQDSRGQMSPQISQANTPPVYPLVHSVVGPVVPAGVALPGVGSVSSQPLALQLRPATSSTDTDNWPKRPILRQQSTIDEDAQQYGKYTKESPSLLHSKRIQELKGIWKRSYDTSDERSSPVTGAADPLIGSPLSLTGDHASTKGTDSPGGSFDQADLGAVKTEPEDSATESGEESNPTLPGSVQFTDGSSEGMEPPDTPSVSKHRSKTLTSDQLLANNDPALLTQQVRNAMPRTGVLFENLPIPDGFLSESNPEQQRRYMASLLERTQTSAIPENQRQYRCLFCPSSFVKAKSCVVHVIETHQVQAKDVLKYVSIERKGSTIKEKLRGKCSMCDYKVNRNYDHLHYHKYFKHGIALPEGYQLYRCEICGKESSSKYSWRTHMDTCHFQGNTCEMCEQSFNSREDLADHYRNFHISKRASPPKKRLKRLTKNVSAPADTSQSRMYIYKCPECSFESSTKDDIINHMASVHDRPLDVPDLRKADTVDAGDKERLQRAQSADADGQQNIQRVKSEDTEDSKEEASFNEETGSVSNHSEYECESPDSSVVQPKEQE